MRNAHETSPRLLGHPGVQKAVTTGRGPGLVRKEGGKTPTPEWLERATEAERRLNTAGRKKEDANADKGSRGELSAEQFGTFWAGWHRHPKNTVMATTLTRISVCRDTESESRPGSAGNSVENEETNKGSREAT